MKGQKTYMISGIPVTFPYEAYPPQLRYMETAINALLRGEHALLESPTGTGKTLCLLCATLAFRAAIMAKVDAASSCSKNTTSLGSSSLSPHPILSPSQIQLEKVPLVIYASRTHSQITQVISELRKTIYRPKIATVTSREQLCVKTEVRSLKSNAAMTTVCGQLVKKGQCEHHAGVTEALSRLEMDCKINVDRLFDIEDLTRFARAHAACPYFVGRSELSQAEVIFMPYNYLVDRKTQASITGLDLNQAIIIFDEAHNIESSCGEAHSTDISSMDLLLAQREIFSVKNCLQKGMFSDFLGIMQLDQVGDVLSRLRNSLDQLPLDKDNRLSREGSFILSFFSEAGIDESNARLHISTLELVGRAFVEASYVRREHNVRSAIQCLASAMRTIFGVKPDDDDTCSPERNSSKEFDVLSRHFPQSHTFFRVYAEETLVKAPSNRQGKQIPPTKVRTINYWCFYPGIAMQELLKKGVYSLLLTSGTMSPLKSFQAELGVNFSHQLENDHVIEGANQLFCSVLKSGPNDIILNSSYQQRDSLEYRIELGRTIAEICNIVPDGLLVFFPSYPLMDGCLEAWQKAQPDGRGTIHQLISFKKRIFVEPKNKTDLPKVMNDYNSWLEAGEVGGAIMFAVCRGKVSEGIDFSDARCRAVIVTGLPYPPLKDPRVELKRAYLDQKANVLGRASLKNSSDRVETLTGEQWYNQSATRAVNQAIGRVIRHKDDYGAILLLDERFSGSRTIAQLSKWLRPHVRIADTFQETAALLREFFDYKKQQQPRPRMQIHDDATSMVLPASHPESCDLFPQDYFINRAAEEARAFFTPAESLPRDVENIPPPTDTAPLYIPSSLTSGHEQILRTFHKSTANLVIGEEGREKAKSFIAKVHANLLLEPRKKFTLAIKKYKARQITVEKLVYDVFEALEGDSLAHLRREFRDFLSIKNHPIFDRIYASLYGKGQDCLPLKRAILEPDHSLDQEDPTLPGESAPKVDYDSGGNVVLNESLSNTDVGKACALCTTHYSDNAYMAKCGHACCFTCWNSQLQRESACPFCRRRTRMPQLRKI